MAARCSTNWATDAWWNVKFIKTQSVFIFIDTPRTSDMLLWLKMNATKPFKPEWHQTVSDCPPGCWVNWNLTRTTICRISQIFSQRALAHEMQHKVKEIDTIVTKVQDFHNQSHDKFKADAEQVYNHSRAMEATLMETMVKVILNYNELFVAPTKTSYLLYILVIKYENHQWSLQTMAETDFYSKPLVSATSNGFSMPKIGINSKIETNQWVVRLMSTYRTAFKKKQLELQAGELTQ